jgi:hypothetical protein
MKLLALISIAVHLILITSSAPGQSSPIGFPELREELVHRAKLDQGARREVNEWMKQHRISGDFNPENLQAEERREFDALKKRWSEIDTENTQWLKQVVNKYGWPTYTMVGNDGGKAAWLLVQHADADPKFQRQCLDLMEKLGQDEVALSDVAYLTDRVLIAEGKKQRYGTQFIVKKDGLMPHPIEDEAGVEERRKSVGLPSMKEYREELKKVYGQASKN